MNVESYPLGVAQIRRKRTAFASTAQRIGTALRIVAGAAVVGLASARAEDPLASPPNPTQSPGPRWSDEQKTLQRKAAGEVLTAIKQAVAGGRKQYVIPPGNYRFDADLGHGFDLTGASDFVLQANGATFWFDGNFAVRFTHCSHVTLRGLTFDMDPLPWIQGKAESIHVDTQTIDFSLEAGFEQSLTSPLTGDRRLLYFDPASGQEIHSRDTHIGRVDPAGQGRWRISGFNGDEVFQGKTLPRALRPGDRLVLLKGGASNFVLTDCSGVVLEDITMYGTSGFGFQEANGAGGNRYTRCRIIRRPGTNRLLAAGADAFHSSCVQRGPNIENCEFSFAADDLLAIHGFFCLAAGPSQGNTALVAFPYPADLARGSTLRFFRPPDGKFIDTAVVKEAQVVADPATVAAAKLLPEVFRAQTGVAIRALSEATVYRVTLDHNVILQGCDLGAGSGACGAGAIVRNSYLHDGHIRGLLAKTENLTVEDNRIERTAYAGIDLEPELYWLEGPFGKTIRIRRNQLDENQWSPFAQAGNKGGGGAITVANSFGQGGRTLVPGFQNEDIEIAQNHVARPGGIGIFVANARNVVLQGNQVDQAFAAVKDPSEFDLTDLVARSWIIKPVDATTLKAVRYPIYVQAADGIKVDGNQAHGGPSWRLGAVGYGPDVLHRETNGL